jgi:hypothetical protein
LTEPLYKRKKDLAAYVAIGSALIVLLFISIHMGWNKDIFMNTLIVTINTLILFGVFIVDSRSLWGKPSFWVLTSLLVFAHLLLIWSILTRYGRWKLTWWYELTLVEALVMLFCRRCLLVIQRPSIEK